ncbi:primosomal protein N' [uncultured Thiodictyon sp.]|uniref:primosomal protein N' n=3 Tax=uncultured Thiodictyon sp. TaxID=1846217 RepID=UPI0025E2919F|nr:primosomal protein N' [uncultured Thiodictyon sp.]
MPPPRAAILRVAVAGPLPGLFDYLPPTDADTRPLVPGTRLLVPFGRGQRVGMLVEFAESSEQEPDRLKPVAAVLDARALLGPADLALIRWAAEYYRSPLGEALFGALPVRLRRADARLDLDLPGLRPSAAGLALDLAALGRAPAQRRVMECLRAAPQGLGTLALKDRLGSCAGPLKALRDLGLIEACRVAAGPVPVPAALPDPATPYPAGPDLNPEQRRAVAAVSAAWGGFAPCVLDGVTGSGKTEVYIRLIAEAIAAGRQALVLVPEIGLTPQLRDRLEQRLPGPHAVLHSALPEAERERAWHSAAAGHATLVLGTRSACFVPLPRLGLIVVDEEHDASLKQQEGFRYSARDLAVRRAQQAACPVILGSATPSLETLYNARLGRYRRLHLSARAGGARAPAIAVLDIRGQSLSAGLSPLLRAQVEAQTGAGNQVILFLNRRGYAPVLTCHDCGWVGACPHCDARLTLHLRLRRLWCHHCGWFLGTPSKCPDCQGLDLRGLGLGTERLEEELRAVFPGVSLARVDRDSTRRKGELDRLLAASRSGEIQILVGTQMLAKGHDFPGVTLVGILDLDHTLYASDFRASERTAQLIVQVAGRAGRADRPGRVVLQTRHPDHPLLKSLIQGGYPGFAELALEEREAAALPPFGHLVLLRADAPEAEVPMDFLRQGRALALTLLADLGETRVQVSSPVPAPMERRAGRYRAQLLVEGPDRPGLQRLLRPWVSQLWMIARTGGLRWSLDVDPQDMM